MEQQIPSHTFLRLVRHRTGRHNRSNIFRQYYHLFFIRCFVPQCEELESTKYDRNWLQLAMPGSIANGKFIPEGCYQYDYRGNVTSAELVKNSTCNTDSFGIMRERCNTWIFADDEATIVNEVRLMNCKYLLYEKCQGYFQG